MNEDLLLQQAIKLAHQSHANQWDKGGKPYIGHPLRVMASLETVTAKIVGVLHDTIEDSDLSLADLRELGFSEEIVTAIDALTKRPGEDYQLYLERVKSNELALQVKIADMRDNLDITRITNPTPKDCQRLEKYQQILPILEQSLAMMVRQQCSY